MSVIFNTIESPSGDFIIVPSIGSVICAFECVRARKHYLPCDIYSVCECGCFVGLDDDQLISDGSKCGLITMCPSCKKPCKVGYNQPEKHFDKSNFDAFVLRVFMVRRSFLPKEFMMFSDNDLCINAIDGERDYFATCESMRVLYDHINRDATEIIVRYKIMLRFAIM